MSWRDTIKIHPAADLFPMMSDDELVALGEDIKRNGLITPIAIIIENDSPVLVDGRNRLDAMERAGLEISIERRCPERLTGTFDTEIRTSSPPVGCMSSLTKTPPNTSLEP